jgi:predicted dithiol-disulfide oxidoreductase (DUF899 family)
MPNHTVGTREEWRAARLRLLEDEKALTRRSDELAEQRQALPWVAVPDYTFAGEDGPVLAADGAALHVPADLGRRMSELLGDRRRLGRVPGSPGAP